MFNIIEKCRYVHKSHKVVQLLLLLIQMCALHYGALPMGYYPFRPELGEVGAK